MNSDMEPQTWLDCLGVNGGFFKNSNELSGSSQLSNYQHVSMKAAP
jgi:hypothetical protein